MVRKKNVKKKVKGGLKGEVREFEDWIKHKRRFFWKLFWVVLFVLYLVYLSNKYLRVS